MEVWDRSGLGFLGVFLEKAQIKNYGDLLMDTCARVKRSTTARNGESFDERCFDLLSSFHSSI